MTPDDKVFSASTDKTARLHTFGDGKATNLSNLKLYDITQVTNALLEHLKGLTNLERLDLIDPRSGPHQGFWLNTQVTDEDVKKLQQTLPNCRIRHSGTPGSRGSVGPLYWRTPRYTADTLLSTS